MTLKLSLTPEVSMVAVFSIEACRPELLLQLVKTIWQSNVTNMILTVFIYLSFFTYLFLEEKSIMDNYIILITTIMILPMTIAIYFTITLNKIAKQNEK